MCNKFEVSLRDSDGTLVEYYNVIGYTENEAPEIAMERFVEEGNDAAEIASYNVEPITEH